MIIKRPANKISIMTNVKITQKVLIVSVYRVPHLMLWETFAVVMLELDSNCNLE